MLVSLSLMGSKPYPTHAAYPTCVAQMADGRSKRFRTDGPGVGIMQLPYNHLVLARDAEGRRMSENGSGPGLLERLQTGPVICAEGYLFEFERRGYLQAGAFVPEVVLEEPGLVEQLHREFVHAGSDVVEAFTYYGHREKLRIIGKEDLLEPLNKTALEIALKVARDTG